MKFFFLPIAPVLFLFALTSCSSIDFHNPKKATCNQLKSDLIFNGATSNTREAEIENAQAPLQRHNYDQDNCE